jgi:hypothetical protein
MTTVEISLNSLIPFAEMYNIGAAENPFASGPHVDFMPFFEYEIHLHPIVFLAMSSQAPLLRPRTG